MRVSIMQPGYLPWLGFFELIYNSDLFVLFDDVQYTKKDWRNRNRIRTSNGWIWLTVPVLTKGNRLQHICQARINNSTNWSQKHLKAVEINYKKAEYFTKYFIGLQKIFDSKWDYLVDLDLEIIKWVADSMGIEKRILKSSELNIKADGQEKIIEVCKRLGSNELYDSKAAALLLNEEDFMKKGIKLVFQNYEHPVYEQVYRPFFPYMSAIDLLFNCGEKSLKVMLNKGYSQCAQAR